MSPTVIQSPETRVRVLYDQLVNSWNSSDPVGFAALFVEDGEVVGFDGTQLAGREEIASTLRHIFADHPTPAYVAAIRTLRFPMPKIALLRAVAGMVPPGTRDIDPALNAVQVLVACNTQGGWRILSFQSTPARFHGRPDLAQALTAELRQHLAL